MGVHLVIRKRGMIREDVQYLITHASYNDVSCYIKEIYFDDFCSKFGVPNASAVLYIQNERFSEIPDEWLDLQGEIVFNNMGYRTLEEIQVVLELELPTVDSNKYDWKRSKGGVVKLVSGSSRKSSESIDKDEWLSPEILLSQINKILQKRCGNVEWIINTFRAIAVRGFECRLLV